MSTTARPAASCSSRRARGWSAAMTASWRLGRRARWSSGSGSSCPTAVRFGSTMCRRPTHRAMPGLQDKVDIHTWQLLKGVALSTLLGVSSELALSGQSDLVQALRMSTQDNVSRALATRSPSAISASSRRSRSGRAHPCRLVVHKDLVLAPWQLASFVEILDGGHGPTGPQHVWSRAPSGVTAPNCAKPSKYSNEIRGVWCGREDSNFHALSGTATSRLRVYQFRHDRTSRRVPWKAPGRW
jgi:hypothetical protein